MDSEESKKLKKLIIDNTRRYSQINHNKNLPEDIERAIKKYQAERRRLNTIQEEYLGKKK